MVTATKRTPLVFHTLIICVFIDFVLVISGQVFNQKQHRGQCGGRQVSGRYLGTASGMYVVGACSTESLKYIHVQHSFYRVRAPLETIIKEFAKVKVSYNLNPMPAKAWATAERTRKPQCVLISIVHLLNRENIVGASPWKFQKAVLHSEASSMLCVCML